MLTAALRIDRFGQRIVNHRRRGPWHPAVGLAPRRWLKLKRVAAVLLLNTRLERQRVLEAASAVLLRGAKRLARAPLAAPLAEARSVPLCRRLPRLNKRVANASDGARAQLTARLGAKGGSWLARAES